MTAEGLGPALSVRLPKELSVLRKCVAQRTLNIKLILRVEQSLLDSLLERGQGEQNCILLRPRCSTNLLLGECTKVLFNYWCWFNYILAKRLGSRDLSQLDMQSVHSQHATFKRASVRAFFCNWPKQETINGECISGKETSTTCSYCWHKHRLALGVMRTGPAVLPPRKCKAHTKNTTPILLQRQFCLFYSTSLRSCG